MHRAEQRNADAVFTSLYTRAHDSTRNIQEEVARADVQGGLRKRDGSGGFCQPHHLEGDECAAGLQPGSPGPKRLNSSRRVSNLDKNRSRTDLGVVMFKWLQLHNARGPTIVHTLDR